MAIVDTVWEHPDDLPQTPLEGTSVKEMREVGKRANKGGNGGVDPDALGPDVQGGMILLTNRNIPEDDPKSLYQFYVDYTDIRQVFPDLKAKTAEKAIVRLSDGTDVEIEETVREVLNMRRRAETMAVGE